MSLEHRTVRNIRLLSKLGGGGMGEVWRGHDERLGRSVAVKAIREDRRLDAGARSRFLREARLLSQLDHPNICRLYDFIEEEGEEFIVLELVEGESLQRRLESDPSDGERLDIAIQIADALTAAHAMSVVHRDLKPDNVMLSADGTVKVLDFGLARPVQHPVHPTEAEPVPPLNGQEPGSISIDSATAFGEVMGTPRFMSPEQACGEAVTAASDVYSFGLLLQALLTRESPYESGLNVQEILHKAACGDHRPVHSRNPRITALLEAMMGLRPAQRPSSAAVAEELRTIREVPGRRRRRRWWAAAFIGLTLVAIVLATLAVLLRHERDRAAREASVAGATTEFLVELFENASPYRRAGDVTARELLDEGQRLIRDRLVEQPEARARLLETMGRIHHGLGRYEEAVALFDEALILEEERLGATHVELSRLRRHLANAAAELGRFELAAEKLQLALAALEAAGEKADQGELSSVLHVLTIVEMRQGRLAEAEAAGRRALALRERLHGPDHHDTGLTAGMLGLVALDRGHWIEAEGLLARALEIQQRHLPPDHPQVTQCLINLATAKKELGQLAAAETMYRSALERIRQRMGDRHPDVAAATNNLGVVLQLGGRLAEAEQAYRDALAIAEERLGPAHPYVGIYRSNVAEAVHLQGRSAEALELYRSALDIVVAVVGDGHPAVAEIERGMAAAAAALGRWPEAERLLLDVIAIRESALGATHPELGRALSQLGELYRASGRGEEARGPEERALDILEPALGSDAAEVELLRRRLGSDTPRLGERQAADPMAEGS